MNKNEENISLEARYLAAAQVLAGLLARGNTQLTSMSGHGTTPELHQSLVQGFDLALNELNRRFGIQALQK